jgi:hypothetical protein
MAYIVPSDISQLALAGGNTRELDTLQILKTKLPAEYTVFHSVHWSREYAGHTVYGEIDFVIVNRSGEVLLIEQKNGPLAETSAGLVKNYTDSSKNVGDQIKRSIDKVKEKFKWIHGTRHQLRVDYLIYCPDYRVKKLNSAALDASRIVDATLSDELCKRIDQILSPGNPTDSVQCDRVISFFQQTFEIVPDIHAHISAHEKSFTRLSMGLVQTVKNIEMEPLFLRIDGTAGSGKSVAGCQLFNQVIAADRRPLLVCFNRPLAERMKHMVEKGGYVNTWYGLCSSFLEDCGHVFNYEEMRTEPRFWDRIQDLVLDAHVPEKWLFDFLIVDEGQDFEPAWFDLLQKFLKDDAGILWLQDADQKIRKNEGSDAELTDFVGYRCRTNYRTPVSIARFMMEYSPYKFECANDLPGRGVGVHRFESAKEQSKIVGSIVQERIKDGFRVEDIVVLSCRGVNNSALSGKSRVGNLTLRQFEGEYDLFGNQVMTSGKIHFDSIYRFKGQQAPAVVVVDLDPDEAASLQSWKTMHAAMTRATVRLDLVTKGDNQITRKFSSF